MRSRTKSILIRLTPEELETITQNAERAKLPREKYCRMVLHGTKIKEAPPAEFYKLITEVRRVGVHLNRILRKAEAGGFLDAPMIRESIKELYATEDMLFDTFQHEEPKRGKKRKTGDTLKEENL